MSENSAVEGVRDHAPTPEMRARVRQLAKVKKRGQHAAKELGITEHTFWRHYREDWEGGQDEVQSALLAKLIAQGMAGNVNAIRTYFGLMGWVAPKRIEHTGKDGQPIETVDLTRLNPAQLEIYGRLAATAAGLDPDAIIIEPVEPSA